MQKKADLHVHTSFSDGTFSPAEVVEYAEKIGLSAIAITDHDSVEGIGPTLEAAKDSNLEIIPGIEFTTEIEDREVHILGFFIDYKQKWLIKELKNLCRLREKRMRRMLDCLLKFGISLELDEVRVIAGKGSLGRLHLATLLYQKGYVASIQEAFYKFIGNGKPCYVRGDRISPLKAISMIDRLGGVSVLAHPYTLGMDELIPRFVKGGLKGIEVYHSDHTGAAASHYKKIADDFGLLTTGGSDCHGMGKGKILMGSVTVPYEVVDRLKEAAGK